ncbi:methyltransferase family protein [Zavarzinia compransoris]|uniref:Isoprenylcysteine carboxylmethyltransferase family protein n=1 Tax=Zavarzinia compransoris TaxID=1264899 RepID=A0A317E520_9PROT|nr:isoprenylcysteine carboxylmethyltransferase family protein [Zavarzinia compransoris]PWR22167.1 isoprenylcysteine carboxylmethyltransferase family protein [Zavarzinia compransoris]TDP47080.1 phospholipid methyltransferase [Zavarzinia compransoris]
MRLPQDILLIAASVIFLAFTIGYALHFRRPEGTPWPMRVLAVLSGATTAGVIAEITDTRATWASFIAAGALLAASALLYGWAIATTRRQRLSLAFSKDAPAFLLVEGPYRLVRHPFYTAYLLYWIGGAIAAREAWLLLAVAVMAAGFAWAALREEGKFAASSLGGAYAAYRARTGMFLPRLRRPGLHRQG